MQIAMMTSWNRPCGIAEFSRLLAEEIATMGHEVLILGNRTATDYPDQNKNITLVPDMFRVQPWGCTNDRNNCILTDQILLAILQFKPDVLHIQFQQTFFTIKEMEAFIDQVPIPVIVTFHDNFAIPTMPIGYIFAYVHRLEMLSQIPNAKYLELPYESYTPRVFVFGMGRNQMKNIKTGCDLAGVEIDHHDSSVNNWLTKGEIVSRIKACDGVVLWYDDKPKLHDYGMPRFAVAGSAAARTAISLHRPVFVNNCHWFGDLYGVAEIYEDAEDLSNALRKVFKLDHIRENSYREYAERHIQEYRCLT